MVADDFQKSDRILSEVLKRENRIGKVEIEEEKTEIVIFSLGKAYYAFYGEDVKEILPYEKITYVPGSPDTIYGIINVRGDIESVVNIHKLMNLPDARFVRNTRILIAAKNGIRSGILVDSVEDVLVLSLSTINPPISTIDKSIKSFVIGETAYRDKSVTVFDVGNIFQKILQ